MKKLLIALFCLSVSTAAVHAQTATPNANDAMTKNAKGAKFDFKNGDTHDFGTVSEGPVAEYKFEFKNTGKEPLIITNASASCGCTTPSWPKEPVLPGKKGEITVKYNTQGRVGPFRKDVYIQSNAISDKERFELHITGTVKAADKPATAPAKS